MITAQAMSVLREGWGPPLHMIFCETVAETTRSQHRKSEDRVEVLGPTQLLRVVT
jgi:hypothetical protein